VFHQSVFFGEEYYEALAEVHNEIIESDNQILAMEAFQA